MIRTVAMPIARVRAPLAFAVAGILSACTGGSPLMARAPENAPFPAGAPNVATVVFLRPHTFAYAQNFRIVDHAGRFVGEALTNAYFVVRPPPGEYVFIVGDDAIDVMYANVAPGFTYFVNVVPVPGSFTVKAQLRPLRPSGPEWRKVRKYLEGRQFVPLYGRGQTEVDRDPGLHSRIDRAKKMWAEMRAQERPAHSLGPTDGVPPPSNAAARP
jgi:hypothetical protein